MLAVAQANQQAEATPAARMHLKKQKHPFVARKEFYDAATVKVRLHLAVHKYGAALHVDCGRQETPTTTARGPPLIAAVCGNKPAG